MAKNLKYYWELSIHQKINSKNELREMFQEDTPTSFLETIILSQFIICPVSSVPIFYF